MNGPRLVAITCLLLVLLALVGRILSNPEVEQPGRPALPSGKIAYLAAQVLPIGDFDREFNVNPENPFVAVKYRSEETRAMITPPPEVVRVRPLPPPGPPVVVEMPILVLPAATPVDRERPECLGVISHSRSGREVLIVRLPGGEEQQLERGARIGEWELLDLAVGGARFRDPQGVEQVVPFVVAAPTVMVVPASTSTAPGEPPPTTTAAGPVPAQVPLTVPPAPPAVGPRPRPDQPVRGGDETRRPPLPVPAPDMVPKPPMGK